MLLAVVGMSSKQLVAILSEDGVEVWMQKRGGPSVLEAASGTSEVRESINSIPQRLLYRHNSKLENPEMLQERVNPCAGFAQVVDFGRRRGSGRGNKRDERDRNMPGERHQLRRRLNNRRGDFTLQYHNF